ncbi:carbohydrate ABC transporter permease, partial [Listeria monocytogenes]|nr:carbohydrate ABC transporter permease [Listeria monocytogenes]
GITLFRGQFTTDWGNLMAASVLAVIPVTIIFVFLQRYLISGLMSGAVKG